MNHIFIQALVRKQISLCLPVLYSSGLVFKIQSAKLLNCKTDV